MASQQHVDKIKQGVAVWNDFKKSIAWRADLSNADLRGMNLQNIDLLGAYLRGANLESTNLDRANLLGADLSEANLSGTILSHADLTNADLTRANLHAADLTKANLIRAKAVDANLGAVLVETILCWADLTGSDFKNAQFGATILGDTNLSKAENLESSSHLLPSIIDHQTLAKSGELPTTFLRGCGLPDSLIDLLPSLLAPAIEFYSCFISYSAKDQDFASRLHADLSRAGIRCWFAPQSLNIGDPIVDKINRAIILFDKMVLILSESSIDSSWVAREIEIASQKENEQHTQVLFPIRLDDEVMIATSPVMSHLREYHIGDFSNWTQHDAYKKALSRLIRDLTRSLTSGAYK